MGSEIEAAAVAAEKSNSARSKGNLITPGCAMLLDINNGDKLTFAHLNKNASVKIGNTKCWLDALVGHPFGSVFEVQSGPKGASFVRVSPSSADLREGIAEKDDGEGAPADEIKSKDNRALIDNNTAQTLSAKDINKMRNEGVSGKEIMEALVANSTTFHTKTAFSQEKYLRRKQKKYAPRVVVRRPSARSVCEAYFAKDPNKTGHLRMDMLALILSLANVGANAEVLVLDMLGGLLTASVAERLGGFGSVCSTYNTNKPQTIDMVRLFNFDSSTSSRVVRAPAVQLISARTANLKLSAEAELKEMDGEDGINIILNETNDVSTSVNPMEVDGTSTSDNVEVSATIETSVILESVEGEGTTKTTQVLETVTLDSRLEDNPKSEIENTGKRRAQSKSDDFEAGKSIKPGRLASEEDIRRWALQGFTSLIVGAPSLDPWTVVEKLLPLLTPSAPFVIYHPYLQPLAECMNKLESQRMAVGLQLQEPWLREYQVLPSRTHPNMQMSSTGGWVLSGICISKT